MVERTAERTTKRPPADPEYPMTKSEHGGAENERTKTRDGCDVKGMTPAQCLKRRQLDEQKSLERTDSEQLGRTPGKWDRNYLVLEMGPAWSMVHPSCPESVFC